MDDVRNTIKGSGSDMLKTAQDRVMRGAQDRFCQDQSSFFTSIGGALMWVILGALVGAVAMWAFDPTMGWARREEVKEHMHEAGASNQYGTGQYGDAGQYGPTGETH